MVKSSLLLLFIVTLAQLSFGATGIPDLDQSTVQIAYPGPGLPLRFNSPDIDGDLTVNLPDVSLLSQDYYGSYNFRSDLNGDGVVNLQDVPIMARNYGAQCP